MCKWNAVLSDFNGKGINFVDEEDSGERCDAVDAAAGKVDGPGAGAGTAAKIAAAVKDADTRALEAAVAARLGLATEISYGADTGRGVISFKFQSLEELDALLDKLGAGTGS